MARTAVVRSISLAPDEADLAEQLAQQIAGGSLSDLTRIFLHWFGEPMRQRLQDLSAAGIDPDEQLVISREGQVSVERELADFYRPTNTWPDDGPKAPPEY